MLPKVSGRAHLDEVVAVTGPDVRLWAMVETPAAVFAVREIAAHPQVDVLVVGTNDLAKELRATLVPGRAPLLPHLATILLAAREAGVDVLDGVYNDVRDAEGFEAECRQGAELGFDGKTLVHPSQVDVANRVWAPDRGAGRARRTRHRRLRAGLRRGPAASSPSTGAWSRTCTSTNARRVLAVARGRRRPGLTGRRRHVRRDRRRVRLRTYDGRVRARVLDPSPDPAEGPP